MSVCKPLWSFVLTTATLFVVFGCGYSPDQKAYDTTANPYDFPPEVLTLLDQVEPGNFVSLDSTVEQLVNIYTTNPELLDSENWKEVVGRLGQRVTYFADSLIALGPGSYVKAAEYLQLAAYSDPEDSVRQERAQLFGVWLDAQKDPRFVAAPFEEADYSDLHADLNSLRHFILGDTLRRRFFREQLKQPVLGKFLNDGKVEAAVADSLAGYERAMLAYAGLYDWSGEPDAVIDSPEVAVLATDVWGVMESWQTVEVYFLPKDTVPYDYRVFATVPDPENEGHWIEIPFAPLTPCSRWRPGQVQAATKVVPIVRGDSLAVSLCDYYAKKRACLEFRDLDTDYLWLSF